MIVFSCCTAYRRTYRFDFKIRIASISIDQNSCRSIAERLEFLFRVSPVPAGYDALTAEEKKIVQRIRR